MYEFLEQCLRNKSEMVIYEAARAIVNIKGEVSTKLFHRANVCESTDVSVCIAREHISVYNALRVGDAVPRYTMKLAFGDTWTTTTLTWAVNGYPVSL